MTQTIASTYDQTLAADGVLMVTLTNVPHPCGGVDGFPLPTRYEVHQPADGETLAGHSIAGWLHTDSMLWGHQVTAVFHDLERLGLEWIDSVRGCEIVGPTTRMALDRTAV